MKKSSKRFNPPNTSRRRTCLHCGEFARIRTSEVMSPMSRITKFQCTNPDCSFAWAEGSEVLYAINTSGKPNPNVTIPNRRKGQAND
ncbi:ogr/Delta-like zinc finger family protein [Motilimonas sp. 1_MG-2023]|uniref:ogr/Delta-like zinc finger family protein n=1 Tax=Motilimonas sp. 1_MG-2023 TaxID=3062672 RepID=UPI0026E48049|nr:ogr/Delta-like zinc finger family protein [Motilimonas sp. 1_MG-2023]MDO6525418.1 ogr/Delta-like zinc finger family protein [Motilimonas sp. 1_MG-2023]